MISNISFVVLQASDLSRVFQIPTHLIVHLRIIVGIFPPHENCNRINSTKSRASGSHTFSEPRLMSLVERCARSRMRVYQCVLAVRAVGVASIGLLT
jgi:hypothetical protein